jgi:aspartyl-tRNA(Asn)/glutamyl-tRNA(Gln) amidotransferase subunit A
MAADAGDLTRRSASELAAAIASGECSAVEVTQAHLDRIESVDPADPRVPARRC